MAPLDTLTVFNFPGVKKPMEVPSGDQNGSEAPSVPGIARAITESRDLNHSIIFPSAEPTYVRKRPSCDSANEDEAPGALTSNWTMGGCSDGRMKYAAPKATAM